MNRKEETQMAREEETMNTNEDMYEIPYGESSECPEFWEAVAAAERRGEARVVEDDAASVNYLYLRHGLALPGAEALAHWRAELARREGT